MRTRSVASMKTAKIGYVVISAAFTALGILFIINPVISAKIIGIITGFALIVFGIVKLIGYFSRDLFRLAFQYDLAFGILLITIGVIVSAKFENALSFISIALGIAVLADGLFKIQISIDAKKFGIKSWWVILLIAVIASAVGISLLLHPFAGTRLMIILFGFSMIFEGALNLFTALTAVKIVKHQKPDIIEIDCINESEDE